MRVTFFYKGQNVGSADVVLTPEYVEEATGYTTRLELSGPGASTEGKAQNILQQMAAPTKICIAAVAAAVVILLILAVAITVRARKNAQKKRRRRMKGRRKRLKYHTSKRNKK